MHLGGGTTIIIRRRDRGTGTCNNFFTCLVTSFVGCSALCVVVKLGLAEGLLLGAPLLARVVTVAEGGQMIICYGDKFLRMFMLLGELVWPSLMLLESRGRRVPESYGALTQAVLQREKNGVASVALDELKVNVACVRHSHNEKVKHGLSKGDH